MGTNDTIRTNDMTEDDTFRKLRRPAAEEMRALWYEEREKINKDEFLSVRIDALRIFLAQYGWTTEDYFSEMTKRYAYK